MLTNGKGPQITSKDRYLCSKGENAQTQRAAQSMQQVMKSTYYAATQKEVRQASFLCRGKRRISAYRRAMMKLSLLSFFSASSMSCCCRNNWKTNEQNMKRDSPKCNFQTHNSHFTVCLQGRIQDHAAFILLLFLPIRHHGNNHQVRQIHCID